MTTIKYYSHIIHALAATAILILQGCSMGGQLLKEAESFKGVTKDEIIIVGTIELTPKLSKEEQDLTTPANVIDLFGYADMHKNRSMIQFNAKPEASDYKLVINPELGKTFFFKVPKDLKYMVEGSIQTEFSRYGTTGKIHLPTWFKINIKPGDKAVYIGDIRYKRDDFNSITDIKLVDNYKKANKQFRKKFGKKYKLRKSLITNIKS